MVEGVLWTLVALLALASAGPLDRYPREAEDYQNVDLSAYANYTANEVCFSDNEVFQKGDIMPNPGPCEECRCEPPSIVCQMVKCPVNNNGCRTIQRPNHCCPDYNCECDYNGQLYSDGERLDLPDQPCQVCYCKGGEVMCTSLTCYTRNDCEPQHVPGQCCPKYTDCPLRDMAATNDDDKNIRARSPNKTANSPKREMQPWLLTNSPTQIPNVTVAKQPNEVTTVNAPVIIVSDWLTERRTTPEAAQVQTNHVVPNPVGTKSPSLTTKAGYEPVSSPLDEVIFTRIDWLKEQNKNVASTTHIVSNLLEDSETTSVPIRTSGSVDITHKTKQDGESTMTPSYTTTGNIDEFTKAKFVLDGQTSKSKAKEWKESIPTNTDPPITDQFKTTMLDTEQKHKDIEVDESIISHDKSTQKPIKQILESYTNTKASDVMINDPVTTEKDKYYGSTVDVEGNDILNSNSNAFHLTETATVIINKGNKQINTVGSLNKDNSHDKQLNALIESTTSETDVTTKNQQYLSSADQVVGNNDNHTKDISLVKQEENLKPNEQENFREYTSEIKTTADPETTTPYFTEDHMVVFEVEPEKFQEGLRVIGAQAAFASDDSITETAAKVRYLDDIKQSIISDTTKSSQNSSEVFEKETTVTEESITDINKPFDESNRSIVVLSSEEAQLLVHEISPKENDNYIKEIGGSGYDETSPKTVKTEQGDNPKKNALNPNTDFVEKTGRLQETSTNTLKNYQLDESSEVENVPPILDLNSHVPFLLVGSEESSESLEDDEKLMSTLQPTTTSDDMVTYTATPANLDSTTTSNGQDKVNKTGNLTDKLTFNGSVLKQQNDTNMNHEGPFTTEPDIYTSESTTHISLTPGDLKVLAEYLINETIKPAVKGNDSKFTPNQWLQGNLTSEEKMSSILAAAGVNVGIMNETNNETQPMSLGSKTVNTGNLNRVVKLKRNKIIEDASKTLGKEKGAGSKFDENKIKSKDSVVPEKYFTNDPSSTVKPSMESKGNPSTSPKDATGNSEEISSHDINLNINEFKTKNSVSKNDTKGFLSPTTNESDVDRLSEVTSKNVKPSSPSDYLYTGSDAAIKNNPDTTTQKDLKDSTKIRSEQNPKESTFDHNSKKELEPV